MIRGGTPVTACISNDEALYYLKIRDHEDGTYTAHYNMSKPGVYQLNIRLNDEHEIFGSPFELNIMPSKTVPDQCIAEGDALKVVYPGVLSSFNIIARDVFGNNKTRGGEPFEVGIMGPATMKTLRDNGNGTYTCFFEAMNLADLSYLSGASIMLMVTLLGKPIQGSPFCPTIVDAPSGGPLKPNALNASKLSAANSPAGSVVTPTKPTNASVASGGSPLGSVEDRSLRSGRMSKGELSASVGPGEYKDASTSASMNKPTPARTNPSMELPASAAGMSKLERARQRALMAKSLNEGGVNESKGNNAGASYGSSVPPPPAPYDGQSSSAASPDLTQRLSRLEALNMSNNGATGAGSPGSRLQSLGARLEAAKQATKTSVTSQNVNSNASGGNTGSVATGNRKVQVTTFDPISVASNIRMGLVGPQPPTLVADEVAMWGTVHRALTMPDVVNQLVPHLQNLKDCFDWVAEDIEGTKIVKLTNPNGGGAARLLEAYDIIPAYLSKKEAKMAFFVILSSQVQFVIDRICDHSSFAYTMQRNAGNVPTAAGSVGLEFSSFVKLLLLICIHSLSKASTFSSLYSTTEVRSCCWDCKYYGIKYYFAMNVRQRLM
jgi:hypothetical protein